VGYNVRIAANVKLMAYYEFVKNETTQLTGYTRDLPDNVLTLRAQFKF
jgi:phosphate-selective porin